MSLYLCLHVFVPYLSTSISQPRCLLSPSLVLPLCFVVQNSRRDYIEVLRERNGTCQMHCLKTNIIIDQLSFSPKRSTFSAYTASTATRQSTFSTPLSAPISLPVCLHTPLYLHLLCFLLSLSSAIDVPPSPSMSASCSLSRYQHSQLFYH